MKKNTKNLDVASNPTTALILEVINNYYKYIANHPINKNISKFMAEETGQRYKKLDAKNLQWRMTLLANKIIADMDCTVLDFYLKINPDLTEKEKVVIDSIKTLIGSVFEITNKTGEFFECFCLTNEKNYKIFPLKKMEFYEDLIVRNYVFGTIFNYENKYYLVEVIDAFENRQRALETVKNLILMNPSKLYQDNLSRKEEIEAKLKDIYSKFIETFKTDIVITNHSKGEKLTKRFLEYIETKDNEKIKNIERLIVPTEKLYTDSKTVKKLGPDTKEDNVGIFVTVDGGLYEASFYESLQRLFKKEYSELIEQEKKCLIEYLTTTFYDLPARAIIKLYDESENKTKFLTIVREVLFEYFDVDKDELYKMPSDDLLREFKEYVPIERREISRLVLPILSSTFKEAKKSAIDLVEVFERILEEQEKEMKKLGKKGK